MHAYNLPLGSNKEYVLELVRGLLASFIGLDPKVRGQFCFSFSLIHSVCAAVAAFNTYGRQILDRV